MAADLEQLKQKYAGALNFLGQPGASLTHVHIQDDKLYVEGTVGGDAIKNKAWDLVKTADPSFSDFTLNLTVDPSIAPKQQMYTVAAGDSLSKIAKHFYGNANEYMKIFDANKDQLSNPDAIKPGQELVIPN